MNILFIFGQKLKLGGHFKSAKAFALELVDRGHNVFILINKDKGQNIFDSENIKIINLRKFISVPENSYINKLSQLLQIFLIIIKYKINIIHSQDRKNYKLGYYISSILKRKFFLTQAGGEFKFIKRSTKTKLIVYSKELVLGYKKIKKENNIFLISERINTNIYFPLKREKEIDFLFLIRFDNDKIKWINSFQIFIKHVEKLTSYTFNFTIAGNGNYKEYYFNQLKEIQKNSKNLKFNLLNEIIDENKLREIINLSNYICGNGRLLMEGMACGIPAIIMGENNEWDIINQNNIEIISYYNFSGRHFRYNNPINQSLLLDSINNNKLKNELSAFSYDYVKQNLCFKTGVNKLLELYKN
ncbi:MAG: glycosyltransferase [Bacteroidales bacterium]|nr:glycosyltransferase [Bacteroidales bacterium]